jgi:hypothetical protein
MDHFAALDISVKGTSICIVDDAGTIDREVKVASEPESLLAVLKNPPTRILRAVAAGRAALQLADHLPISTQPLPSTLSKVVTTVTCSVAKSAPIMLTNKLTEVFSHQEAVIRKYLH